VAVAAQRRQCIGSAATAEAAVAVAVAGTAAAAAACAWAAAAAEVGALREAEKWWRRQQRQWNGRWSIQCKTAGVGRREETGGARINKSLFW